MNKELKQAWIDALRSGKYTQGQGLLKKRTDDIYCCLGVLCEVSPELHFVSLANQNTNGGYLCAFDGDNTDLLNSTQLPNKFSVRENLTKYTRSLINMNDNIENPSSFSDIANWIEENII
jgi:hypothetical protein